MNNPNSRNAEAAQVDRSTQAACGKFTKTLDQLLDEVEVEKTPAATAGYAKNMLYDGHIEEMLDLVRCISRVAPLAGPARGHGYENPSLEFLRKVKDGQMDLATDEQYDDALQACELLASFWEGEAVLDGMTLARNALVYAVLNDDELRLKALARTSRIVASCHEACERAQVSPLE